MEMDDIQHRTIQTNGIEMHIAELGSGPLVVMCHGFPESWYSWRHQLRAVANAGFHAVAPDMRGYGRTEAPAAIDQYTLLHLVGDVVGLVDAVGGEPAVIAGHDWGATVAWHAALLRPDKFRGVIGLSVPFRPRPPAPPACPGLRARLSAAPPAVSPGPTAATARLGPAAPMTATGSEEHPATPTPVPTLRSPHRGATSVAPGPGATGLNRRAW